MFKNLRASRRLSAILAVLTITAVTGAAVALASSVDVAVVDVTDPTNTVTLAPSGSGSITINMRVTGAQVGTATFEVYRNWTLTNGTWAGSNAQEFSVAPRAATDPATTFSTTGTVTVDAGQADGSFPLTVGVFDITNSNATGAKLAAGSSGSYNVVVETPAQPTPTDTTPPVITETILGTLGLNGWYTSDVDLSWDVTDGESLITSASGCDPVSITSDQGPTDSTCSATSAGGTASKTVSIKRDASAPTNIAFGSDVAADGAKYFPNNVPTGTGCTADDAPSGLASCIVTGRSTDVGTHTLTATATDNAGNSSTATRTYSVRVLTLSGFFQPVDMGSTVNTVKNGSTVPLKFTVADEGVAQTSTSIVQSFKTREVSCGTLSSLSDDIEMLSTGGTALRYDATAGQFIQNWQTPKKASACFVATVTTIDGTLLSANFKLK